MTLTFDAKYIIGVLFKGYVVIFVTQQFDRRLSTYLYLPLITSLPASRKTPHAEKIPTSYILITTALVYGIYSVLGTILYVFLLRTLDCSKKNTTVLIVLSIVPFIVSSTASCLYPHCTASIEIILDFGAFRLQV
jgi:hypothetical protein